MPTNANKEYSTNTIIIAHNTNRTTFPTVPPSARFLLIGVDRRFSGSAGADIWTEWLLGAEECTVFFDAAGCDAGCGFDDADCDLGGVGCGLGGAAVAERP